MDNLQSNSENTKVFIMINNNDIYIPNKVVSAYDYQENALNNYIDNKLDGQKKYIFNCDIIFYIDKFDSSNLKGEYSDFYTFIREDGSKSILSKNKDKLSNFCGYINRLTCI